MPPVNNCASFRGNVAERIVALVQFLEFAQIHLGFQPCRRLFVGLLLGHSVTNPSRIPIATACSVELALSFLRIMAVCRTMHW